MADIEISTLPPNQQLVNLINRDNNKNFLLEEVLLSEPVPVVYNNRNTMITVTASPGSKYMGSKDFYYNRLSLNKFGYTGIMSEVPLTREDILGMVAIQKQVDLWPDEFETFIVPVLEEGEVGKIQLRAKSNAIKWLGETEIEYLFKLPDNLDLLHQLLHFTLPDTFASVLNPP